VQRGAAWAPGKIRISTAKEIGSGERREYKRRRRV
jgi:hypothetical protein